MQYPKDIEAVAAALQDLAGDTTLANLLNMDAAALDGAYARARALLDAGHHEAARATLQGLVLLCPTQAKMWRLLGFAYARCHQTPAAYDAFARACSLDPDDAIAALMLGECALFVLGPEKGVAQLERTLRWAPDAPQVYPYVQRAKQLIAMRGMTPAVGTPR